jgi:hypothetical protein
VDTNANVANRLLRRFGIKKIAGEQWLWTAEYYTVTPGLNLRFGKLQHADDTNFTLDYTYRKISQAIIYIHIYLMLIIKLRNELVL